MRLKEGLHLKYWKANYDPDDPTSNPNRPKLELFLILQDQKAWETLEAVCQTRINELLTKHKTTIKKLTSSEQEVYNEIRVVAKNPEAIEFSPPRAAAVFVGTPLRCNSGVPFLFSIPTSFWFNDETFFWYDCVFRVHKPFEVQPEEYQSLPQSLLCTSHCCSVSKIQSWVQANLPKIQGVYQRYGGYYFVTDSLNKSPLVTARYSSTSRSPGPPS